jgi:hypothetical protein
MCACLAFGCAIGSAQYKSVNPKVADAVSQVSEDRITSILNKLESFGTRNLMSSEDDPKRGIGAARRWLYAELKSYSPRLEVTYNTYRLKKIEGKNSRVPEDVDLYNVVAVLPGKGNPNQRILITAHYDTIVLAGETGANASGGAETPPNPDFNTYSPGVNDDGSGIACVLELARILSQYEFKKTLVFVAFSGEEEGILGSTLYSAKMRAERQKIEAVLNNDIIGSVNSDSGESENRRVRVFSEDPSDSPSRTLARYVKDIGQRYVPLMTVDAVFRSDRFGRSGDQAPFVEDGFAAVRFSSAEESLAHQHTATDTLEFTSVPYIARVTKINAAVAASLAWAPIAPRITEEVEQDGRKRTTLLIGRGKSQHDADLKWKRELAEDLLGHVVVRRSTSAPFWEQDTFVAAGSELLLPGLSIDQYVFGVKAVDREGNESLVSPYVPLPRGARSVDIIDEKALEDDQ